MLKSIPLQSRSLSFQIDKADKHGRSMLTEDERLIEESEELLEEWGSPFGWGTTEDLGWERSTDGAPSCHGAEFECC